MTGHDEYAYATDEDLSAIEQMIVEQADKGASGYPSFLEPEPLTEKKRFGRVKEIPIPFSVGLANSGGDGQIELMFMTEDAAATAARLEGGELPVATGWSLDASMPGSGRITSNGGIDPKASARWLVDVVAAEGCPLPTGRWRCITYGNVWDQSRPSS